MGLFIRNRHLNYQKKKRDQHLILIGLFGGIGVLEFFMEDYEDL